MKQEKPPTSSNQEETMTDNNIDLSRLTDTLSPLMDSPEIYRAMGNLAKMPPLNIEARTPEPYLGFSFKPAKMGLWKAGYDLKLVFAAEGTEPQFVTLEKFIPLVENMDDSRRGTIILQNQRPLSDKGPARGQVIARIVARCSCVNIFRGVHGVAIGLDETIDSKHSFQIDRSVLTTYYLFAKLYLGDDDRIRQIVAATEGLRSYEIRASDCGRDDLMLAAQLIG